MKTQMNSSQQTIMNNPEQALASGAMSSFAYLTPDALMNYCASRLRGLDEQIQEKFAKQKLANHDSALLSKLQGDLNFGHDDLQVSGKPLEDGTIKDAAAKLIDTANHTSDPATQQSLLKLAGKLVTVTGNPPNADFDRNQPVVLPPRKYSPAEMQQMIGDPVGGIQKDINSGTELDMIQLQSIMSQRQTAVTTVTQMVQALGEQLNKIAGNIGH